MNLILTKEQEQSYKKMGLDPDRIKRGFAQSVADQEAMRTEAARIRARQKSLLGRFRKWYKSVTLTHQ